jgi:multiple sugar transport system substrate-binding protein
MYLRPNGKNWIGVPLGAAGSMLVYRQSMVKAAGYDAIPKDTAGFLALIKALKAKDTPSGFALGNATATACGPTGSCGRTAASWSTSRTSS